MPQRPDPNAPASADDPKWIFTPQQRLAAPQLATVDSLSRLLDTKFHVPGTNIRFGADFLMGLMPGVGDSVSLGFSALLIATMAKHGASGRLVAKMLANVCLDAIVGTVPILGNVFDLYYKANTRNARLMQEYYVAGKHRGSVWPIVLGVLVVMLILLSIVLVVAYYVVRFLYDAIVTSS